MLYYLTLIIATINIVLTFFNLTGKLKNEDVKGIKGITTWGWMHFVLSLAFVILPIVAKRYQDIEDKRKVIEIKVDQNKRDSSLKATYDSSYHKTAFILSETLGKYGFKLDSVNKILTRLIKDSSKTKVIETEDPVLTMNTQGENTGIEFIRYEDGLYHYRITLISADKGSSNFDIRASLIVLDSLKGLTYLKRIPFIEKNERLPKNGKIQFSFGITYDYTYNYLFLYIRGNYKNLDASKSFPMDIIFRYNKLGKSTAIATGNTRAEIIRIVEMAEKTK